MDYLHEKIILANQIPIDEAEAMEYAVEVIPDPALRDQARIQTLARKEEKGLRCVPGPVYNRTYSQVNPRSGTTNQLETIKLHVSDVFIVEPVAI